MLKFKYKNHLTLKIILFLVVSDILETLTHFCFKKSALPQSSLIIKNLSDLFIFLKAEAFSGYLWLGFLCAFLVFVIWSTILSKIDLSVAVPIASFSYILVPLVSIFFLHEEMAVLDWTGIFFILTGVIIVSKSAGKTKIIIT